MGYRWLLALALAGCFSSKTGGKPTPTNTAVEPAKPKRDHLAAINDSLGFLPIDAEMVVHLDAERLRRSAIWRQYEPVITNAASARLQEIKDACDLDPIAQLRTLRVAIKDLGDGSKPSGVIVLTGLDSARLLTCLSSEHARRGKPADVTVDGNIVVSTGRDGHPFAMELLDRATIVIVFGQGADRARLDEVVNSGAPLRRSPAFTEIFSTINTQSALWFLMNGSSKAFENLSSMGYGFRSMFGSVGLVDGLSASMRLRVDSPGAAAQMSSMMSSQVGMVKSFVERLDITTDANDVVFELGMTDAQITSLLGLMGGMFGATTPAPPSTP